MGRFCQALGLNQRQRFFFENLIRFNQANETEAKCYYYEQLLPILKKEFGTRLTANQYDYYRRWYVPIIREMVGLEDFREEPKWISRRLRNKVSPAEAREAVQLLIELKLIKRNADGRLQPLSVSVTTAPAVGWISVFKFHEAMLDAAKESLKLDRGRDREISSISVALTPQQFQQCKLEIQEFENRLMQNFEKTDPEARDVYQFNFQLFPVTDIKQEVEDVMVQKTRVG